MSVTSRIEGSGGKMYVPRAMYSLRMSFWIVPRSCVRRDALTTTDRLVEGQQDGRRGIDGHRGAHPVEADPVEEDLHVGDGVDRTPTRPTSPAAIGSSLS